ncbi:MAG TPA: hypothetical protein PLP25_09730 [Candidatus Limiplasma sp.]|nr:hypothetical protein [Candidatus Limiplasma sp.]HPS82120.1 hypothetical protein [Candidatus Limiplasma sp.]
MNPENALDFDAHPLPGFAVNIAKGKPTKGLHTGESFDAAIFCRINAWGAVRFSVAASVTRGRQMKNSISSPEPWSS